MKISVTEYSFKIDFPLEKGIKLVFVSDLHGADNAPVLDLIASACPDAVLVGGDYVHSKENYLPGLEFLKESAKKYPTFVSLGNHERKSIPDIIERTKETGVVLLDNSFVSFAGIKIGGLSSGYAFGEKQRKYKPTPPPDIGFLDRFSGLDGYKILLCHHPEYYDPFVKERNINLILSGHAHGGQWRVCGRGIFAPGQGIFPKYTSGLYECAMIVCRGIGNPIALPRINNSPEIVVIKLC